MSAWVGGASVAEKQAKVPKPESLPGQPPLPPIRSTMYPQAGDDGPLLHLPVIENGARRLLERRVLDSGDFYSLNARAKQNAFSITADLTRESLEKMRGVLYENLQQGTSYEGFKDAVLEQFDRLPISPAHLEQVYRNNVNQSFSQGMNEVLDDPIVGGGFPYRVYVAVHDARARHEHRDLEHLGLNGTAVYFKDDPTWLRFEPPWDWGCRCGWIAISTETAAGMGVKEAQDWIRTGVEPAHVFVNPPPFSPPASWDRAMAGV